MVGGVGVYCPVGQKRGASGRRRAEAAGEELWVPIPEPRHQGRQLIWRRQREQGSHLLHQKAILRCHEEGVLCRLVRGSVHVWIKEGRPVQSFTHGRVKEGRPDEGARDGAKGPLAPAAMPTRVLGMAPMAGAAPKGPVAPAVGPVRALAPVVEKVRAAGGWWRHLRHAHKR
jgi:hypothetical protein